MNLVSTHFGAAIQGKLCYMGNVVAGAASGTTAVDITGLSSLTIFTGRTVTGTMAIRLTYTLNSVDYVVQPFNQEGLHIDTAYDQLNQADFDLTKLPAGVTSVIPTVLPAAGTTTCVAFVMACFERKAIGDATAQGQAQVILG